jgi:NADP-dependent 3-hydroxy-3-methylglutaryl-CoA reductase
MTDTIPGRGQYTEDARRQRLDWLRGRSGTTLASLETTGLDPRALTGNLENFVGTVEVPVGLAGPLLFNGDAAQGSVVAPMATTEGALVASASRGARAITACGGVTTKVLSQRMTRAPAFEFADIATAVRFTSWLNAHRQQLQEQVQLVSRHAKLVDVEPFQIGRYLHVRFVYETADAAGQNMTTAATWQICRWLADVLAEVADIRPERTLLEGNLSGDKKVSIASVLGGRGSRVTAECRLSPNVVASVLKTTPEAMVKGHVATVLGAQQAGTVGYGVNAANTIAALFVATGQDVASVHESGVSIYSMELDGGDLVASILLPSLVTGTVGGGTGLPHQQELLAALGCAGAGGSTRFAEIVAGFALALDVSTAAAMASGQFADAHQRLGRSRPVDWLQSADLNAALLQPLLADHLGDAQLRVIGVTPAAALHGDGISSHMGALAERRKLTGLHPVRVNWIAGDGAQTEIDLVAKVKPRGKEVVAGIAKMASLCGPDVFREWNRWGGDLEFADSHRRELSLYRRMGGPLAGLLPRCYGILEDRSREAYIVLMERIHNDDMPWDRERIDDVLREVAQVHGHWLGRDQEVLAEGWLHHVPGPAHVIKAMELWKALARYIATEQPELMTSARLAVVQAIAEDAGFWTQEGEGLPQTVVHNDFNPRNVAVSDGRVVVYDWELATIDVPQRDVAELLAFTLGPDATTMDVDHHLSVHADAMALQSPRAAKLVASYDYRLGYQLGLRKLLLSRLPLYAAAHTHREFEFVPRVVRSSFHLWNLEAARNGV